MMKKTAVAMTALVAAWLGAQAASFDFKDAKGVNNVSFVLDAPLESISGTGTGISGTVKFDPAKPEATSGAIVLKADSLMVGNPMMREHMLGEGWLNVAKYGDVTFTLKSLSGLDRKGDVIKAQATGSLTLKGVTKEITVPVTLTYLPDKLGARTGGKMQGDLLVLRSEFSVNRSDYGIKAGEAQDKVAESILIKVAIAGASPKS